MPGHAHRKQSSLGVPSVASWRPASVKVATPVEGPRSTSYEFVITPGSTPSTVHIVLPPPSPSDRSTVLDLPPPTPTVSVLSLTKGSSPPLPPIPLFRPLPPLPPDETEFEKDQALFRQQLDNFVERFDQPLRPQPSTPAKSAATKKQKSEHRVESFKRTSSSGHFCELWTGISSRHGKVALKRPRDQDSKSTERFVREGKTWRKLRHPYVLEFYGTCHAEGEIFLMSPFIENGDLNRFLKNNPLADRIRLLYETAEAIHFLHRNGLVHGDIKANNILVSDSLHALLCDFGLTKRADTKTSTSLRGAGTYRWQAPELWEGGTKTTQSDVYAFGMTIAEVLSGTVPFPHHKMFTHVCLAVIRDNERPRPRPISAPHQGSSYHMLWSTASLCWVTKPELRIDMGDVVSRLDPALAQTKAPDAETFSLEWLLEITMLIKQDPAHYTAKEVYNAAREVCPTESFDRKGISSALKGNSGDKGLFSVRNDKLRGEVWRLSDVDRESSVRELRPTRTLGQWSR